MAERLGAAAVMHHANPPPHVNLRLDDDDMLIVGDLRMRALHTPGHTQDSNCLVVEDRVFTGDTLLIGGTGRTDLLTGDPDQLYDSLFGKLLRLDPGLSVFPAHEYKGRSHSAIAAELVGNPRLQKREWSEFTKMMRELNIAAPTHLTEALRINLTGSKSVRQLLAEAVAKVPFMTLEDLDRRLSDRPNDLVVVDLRESDAFKAGHISGSIHVPRGQLELLVNETFPDPTVRIVTCCEFGKISTLAAATLRDLGFQHVAALDGGMKNWREAGFHLEC